jgi:hypothetical protein
MPDLNCDASAGYKGYHMPLRRKTAEEKMALTSHALCFKNIWSQALLFRTLDRQEGHLCF